MLLKKLLLIFFETRVFHVLIKFWRPKSSQKFKSNSNTVLKLNWEMAYFSGISNSIELNVNLKNKLTAKSHKIFFVKLINWVMISDNFSEISFSEREYLDAETNTSSKISERGATTSEEQKIILLHVFFYWLVSPDWIESWHACHGIREREIWIQLRIISLKSSFVPLPLCTVYSTIAIWLTMLSHYILNLIVHVAVRNKSLFKPKIITLFYVYIFLVHKNHFKHLKKWNVELRLNDLIFVLYLKIKKTWKKYYNAYGIEFWIWILFQRISFFFLYFETNVFISIYSFVIPFFQFKLNYFTS